MKARLLLLLYVCVFALCTFFVMAAKAATITITGPTGVCPRIEYSYSASASNLFGSVNGCFQWSFWEGGQLVGGFGDAPCSCYGQSSVSNVVWTWTSLGAGQVKVQFIANNAPFCPIDTKYLDVNIRVFSPGPPTGLIFCGSGETRTITTSGIPFDKDNCYYHYQYDWLVPSGWSVVPTGGLSYTAISGGIRTFATSVNVTSQFSALASGYSGNYIIQVKSEPAWPWPVQSSGQVWVGIPSQPGPVSGNTTPSIGSIYQYNASYGSTAAANYDWLLPYYGNPVWSVSGGTNTLTLNAIAGSSSGNVQVFGQNVCGNSGASRLRVFPQEGPCTTCPRIKQDNKLDVDSTFAKIALYPNPANTEFKVRLRAPAEQEGELSLMDLTGNVKRNGIIQKGTQWITLGTSDLFPGMYVIKINDGSKVHCRKVLVQH